jgi:mono/diheme cytochrome c family protein
MNTFKQNTVKRYLTVFIVGLLTLLGITSCTSDPNSPGIEYMPDMYRPQTYEAYLEKVDIDSAGFYERNINKIAPDYEDLTDEGQAAIRKEVSLIYAVWSNGSATRKPVKGSIAVGKMPYPFTKNQRDLTKDMVNPVPYSKSNLKEGKAYYEIFCDHCHGEKGDGNGPMVTLGVYPAQPPSYTGSAKDLTAGEIHHTIYHGKGVMGSHASQISEDRRWKIVHYVQSLQGKKAPEPAKKSTDAKADSTLVAAAIDLK